MRAFAELVKKQHPEELAAAVDKMLVPSTLDTCRTIQKFFTRYVAALTRRVG